MSAPFARQWPWPRWVEVIRSSRLRPEQTPTATASSPMYRCARPGILPLRYSSFTRSSNMRMVTISRYRCSHGSSPAGSTGRIAASSLIAMDVGLHAVEVDAGGDAGLGGVTGLDRGQDGTVLVDGARGALGDPEDLEQRVAEYVADGVQGVADQAVAGCVGHGDVEAQIGVDEALCIVVLERRGHGVDGGLHLLEISGFTAVRGQLGGRAVQDPPQFEQIGHAWLVVQRHHQAQRAVQWLRRLGDRERAAHGGGDDALRLEDP